MFITEFPLKISFLTDEFSKADFSISVRVVGNVTSLT